MLANNSSEWNEDMAQGVQLLVEYKVDPNIKSVFNGQNAFYLLVMRLTGLYDKEQSDEERFALLATMLDQGADPYSIIGHRDTIFHLLKLFDDCKQASYVCKLLLNSKKFSAQRLRECLALRDRYDDYTPLEALDTQSEEGGNGGWKEIADMLRRYQQEGQRGCIVF
jgi:hypothetical protein